MLAYVADISGHGLQAGILMGMFKTAARTAMVERPSLATLMERINEVPPQVKEPEMYATCAAVRIGNGGGANERGYRCEIANAGHPAILYFSKSRSEVRKFKATAPVLGLLVEPKFLSETVEAHAGDLLLIATDGVMEVLNAKGEEFEMRQVETLLAAPHEKPLEKIAAGIAEAAGRWGRQTDDQTLLLVRFRDGKRAER